MQIGTSIKTIRKQLNLTQDDFAEKVGITQSYLSLIETGVKTPSSKVLERIADVTQTPVGIIYWLATEESDVSDRKRATFRIFKPAVDKMILTLLNP